MKKKQRVIELPSPPKKWEDMTLAQWKIYYDLAGKHPSDTAFMAKAFLLFCGLKPLLYAERWRSILAKLPFIGRFVRMTGRQVAGVNEGHIRWRQYYRLQKGRSNKFSIFNWLRPIFDFQFSISFWLEDEEVMSFQKAIEFLTTDPAITINPVETIVVRGNVYHSHKRRLSDMVWVTYNTCNALIDGYHQTKNKNLLYQFVANLYRIPGMDIPYIKKTAPDWQLQLILLFWDGCQKDFARNFKRLFKEAKKNKQPKRKDYLVDESEITVFLGRESHLPPEGVRGMLVWDALTYLDQNARKVEAEEKQLLKMKGVKRR